MHTPTVLPPRNEASGHAVEKPSQPMSTVRYAVLWRWLGIGGLLLVLGIPFGVPWLFLLLGSVLYNIWHLYNLDQLRHWLDQRAHFTPPTSRGLWGEVLDGVYRLQVRHRKRKRKLAKFLHGFQEASAALPVGVVVLNQRGEVDWCNPAAGDLLGIDWPQDQGRELVNLVRHPDLRKGLEQEEGFQCLRISSPQNDHILEISMLPYSNKRLRLILVRDLTSPQVPFLSNTAASATASSDMGMRLH